MNDVHATPSAFQWLPAHKKARNNAAVTLFDKHSAAGCLRIPSLGSALRTRAIGVPLYTFTAKRTPISPIPAAPQPHLAIPLLGIELDRLFISLIRTHHMRDVILFPARRPETPIVGGGSFHG